MHLGKKKIIFKKGPNRTGYINELVPRRIPSFPRLMCILCGNRFIKDDYPLPGKDHISHQTRRSENHRLDPKVPLKKKTIAMAMSVEGRLPHPNFPLSKRSGGPLMNLRLKVPWKLSKVKPVDPTFMRDVWYRTYNIDIKC